jgi:ABC-type nitrate/sulfonate/bicarbonate transport system substrate-binding protein
VSLVVGAGSSAAAGSTPKHHITINIGVNAVPGTNVNTGTPLATTGGGGPEAYYDYVGLLRPALAKYGITIGQVSVFAGGPALEAAIQSGSVDIGLTDGDTVVLQAGASGLNLKILDTEEENVDCWLVAGPHGPTTLAGLAGETVGDPKGTASDRYISGLLSANHLTGSVTLANLPQPSAVTALENGSIAAFPEPPQYAIELEHEIGGSIINKASVTNPNLQANAFTVASGSFLAANPWFAKAWIAVHALAATYVQKHARPFFAWNGQLEGASLDTVLSYSSPADWPTEALTKAVINRLKQTLAWNMSAGIIKSGAVSINSLIAPGVPISPK